jgi:hypothetical protein
MSTITETETYNGWANYETWNVALWIQNDEGLYGLFYETRRARSPYKAFVENLRTLCESDPITRETPDGVRWDAPELDLEALNALLEDE